MPIRLRPARISTIPVVPTKFLIGERSTYKVSIKYSSTVKIGIDDGDNDAD